MNGRRALARLSTLQAEERPGVVIVAAGATPQDLAPYAKTGTWELWGCNSLVSPFATWDDQTVEAHRWFQIHPLAVCSENEVAWACRCPVPIYCVEGTVGVPMAVSYPIAEVETWPLSAGGFASTFAYEIALALLEGKDRIHLAGLNYSTGGTLREVTVEGPNLQWWIAGAIGLGIEVTWSGGFDPAVPMQGWRYGLDYWEERQSVAAWCWRMRDEIRTQPIDGDTATGPSTPVIVRPTEGVD